MADPHHFKTPAQRPRQSIFNPPDTTSGSSDPCPTPVFDLLTFSSGTKKHVATDSSSNFRNTTSSEQLLRQFKRGMLTGRAISTTNASSTAAETPAESARRARGASTTGSSLFQRRLPGALTAARTPRSAGSTVTNDITASSAIVAIVEGRGHAKGEVGLASIDLQDPHLILCQFSDTSAHVRTLTRLHVLDPAKIIVPHTACDGPKRTKSDLVLQLQEVFPNCTLSSLPRRFFNEANGLMSIKHLCAPEYASVELQLTHKYYSLAAAAALLKSLEFSENFIYARKSLKVEFKGSEHTTLIDSSTIHRLEILQNLKSPRSEHSLFGVVNHCKLPGGRKLLRANLLQPPCHLPTIENRLDCVQEMVENPELFYGLQTVLGNFVDVDYLLAQCVQVPKQMGLAVAEQRINFIIGLKTVLGLIGPLQTTLNEGKNPYFVAVKEQLSDPRYTNMLEHVKLVISDDARIQKGSEAMRQQRCFAIRSGLNGLLDIARRIYCEIVEDMSSYVDDLGEKLHLPVQLHRSAQRGFHLQIAFGNNPTRNIPTSLPDIFIQVHKSHNNVIICTTENLLHLDRRARDALDEIQSMSNIVITELINTLREHMGCLYQLSEAIAHLDMLVSFAHVSSVNNYIRPEFSETLAIQKGKHPILESFLGEAVPNNVFASSESNLQIITGPNMSGKSTYLRQVALLQVMAQIGCYIPAEQAAFRLIDQIFSRIGTEDSIENNASTFTLEMMEMNYILQNVGEKSLVIIDELGKGTSSEEGTAISWVMCEHLIKTKAFVFVATHHLALTKLESIYFNVTNYHFETVEETNSESSRCNLHYTYNLTEGITPTSNYGVRLAEMTSMPKDVLTKAKKLVAQIGQQQTHDLNPEAIDPVERATYTLAANLIMVARNFELSDDVELLAVCENMKTQFLEEVMLHKQKT